MKRVLARAPLITFAVCIGLLVARLPEAILRGEFWAEDGLFYSQALAQGPETLFDPYAGYLIVGLRVVAWVQSLIPPAVAPAFGNAIALITMGGVAAYAATQRMPWSRTTGIFVAVLIVLAPVGFELIGTVVHMVWPLTLWMGLVAVSHPPQTSGGRRLETAGLVGTGLTGIGGLLTFPLFLRGPRYRLITVGAVALVQLLMLALTFSERPEGGEVTPQAVPYVWLLRGVVTPILGDRIASAIPALAVAALALAVLVPASVLLLRTPRKISALAVLLILGIPTAGILMGGERTDLLLNPAWAPRYFWSASVGFGLLASQHRSTLMASPLIVLLVIGSAVEFRIQPASTQGWASKSSCIGGSDPCIIPVAPGDKWNVRWNP